MNDRTTSSRSERSPNTRILNAICKQPWAITSDALQSIISIAHRDTLTIGAVEAQLGRPLDNTQTATIRDGIATIPVSGPIFRYAGLFTQVSGATSIEGLSLDFNLAMSNPAVKAIILSIDSPGGEVSGVSEFAEMVYASRGAKPIVAYAADETCSAAYWIAAACDEIVMADTALLGSIGVVAAIPDPSKDKEMTFVSSQSPNKRPDVNTESGKAQIQTMLDDLADVFVGAVARYRGVSADTVLADYGQGGAFVGQKAVKAGLADRIGSYEALMAELTAQTEEPPPTPEERMYRSLLSFDFQPVSSRSTGMNWKEFVTGAAKAQNVDLDDDSFPADASAEEVTALQAQLNDSKLQLASLQEAQTRQAAALHAAADERRATASIAYAEKIVAAGLITPASAGPLSQLALRAMALDEGLDPEADAPRTVDLLEAFTASLPPMTAFTMQHVRPDDVAGILATATKTKGIDGKPEMPTANEVDAQLALTSLGRAILADRKSK